MRRGLEEVRQLLGPPGAVERAADEIAKLLTVPKSNANDGSVSYRCTLVQN